MRRLVIGLLVAAVALVAGSAHAAAQETSDDDGVVVTNESIGVWVGTQERIRFSDAIPPRGPLRVCRAYVAVQNPGGEGLINIERPRTLREGGGYYLGCDGDLITDWTPFIYTPGTSPITTEDDVILAAVDRATARLDTPEPAFSPAPTGQVVVGVDVWLWLPDQDFENSGEVEAEIRDDEVLAVAGPLWARAWAVTDRQSVQWDMGDGTVLRCTGPAYDNERTYDDQRGERGCHHVFEVDGPTTVTTTVFWDVMVESSESGGPVLFAAAVPGPIVTTPLDITEFQAELTPN